MARRISFPPRSGQRPSCRSTRLILCGDIIVTAEGAPERDRGDRSRDSLVSGICHLVCSSLAERRRESRALDAPVDPALLSAGKGSGYGYSQIIPAFPARCLNGLWVLSPGSGLFCPRCPQDTSCERSARVAAPGPHRFTVRRARFVQWLDERGPSGTRLAHLTRAAAIASTPDIP
jgi:hypothetical protein